MFARPTLFRHTSAKSLLPATLLAAAALATPVAPTPLAAQEAKPPTEEQAWQLIQPPQASLVLASDGSLIGEIGRQWRTSVSINTLPLYVPEAFVAIEDQRFFEHDGVDVIGVAGAIKDALGGHVRGASTITQQLVGNMHPDLIDRSDMSISRKLREQAAAREMERHYTKQQILEAYLNQIDFGHGWYGVETAALHYFGKPASQLTLAEAATLAALPKGPAIYDPIRHPDRARARRNLVLSLMAQQHYITTARADSAEREPVVTAPNAGMSAPAPYLVDAVRQEAERAGIPVENGGYRIYTTINPALQADATQALRDGAARAEAQPGYPHPTMANHPRGDPDYLEGMVLAMDPVNGNVLALVGGRDHAEAPFDRALNAVRQPGSAFKPIVYAAAIADSVPANEILPDTAIAIPLENGTVYRPSNDDGRFLGDITLRQALVKSRNVVAVELGQQIGMDSVISLARRLGIETPIAPYPSSAIGASAVRPVDLVSAYTVFDNLGAVVQPHFVTTIEDRAGQAVFTEPRTAPAYAMDPRVAFIVRNMMRDVVSRGTATIVRRYVPASIPVAGKTGTTNDNTNVWFIGMTPDLVAGVWLGFDTPTPISPHAFGGSYAAPIWGEMVQHYYEGRTPAGMWQPPGGLVVAQLDRDTGQLATDSTPPAKRYTEYFIPGTEPAELRPSPWRVFTWGPIVF
ncbi:MAG TPA: PBP1A family penicillin-binding protein [Gemmatimonadaceae bacterium]|nr:PBP1A family penicillin-binding protein [Gemmatimonadaceae bacterium]